MNSNRIVIGSCNTGTVIKTERLPMPGETLLGGQFATAAGGKGANQAVAAARAERNVTLIARIGTDHLGDETFDRLYHEGIHCRYVCRDKIHPTGVALITISATGEGAQPSIPGRREIEQFLENEP